MTLLEKILLALLIVIILAFYFYKRDKEIVYINVQPVHQNIDNGGEIDVLDRLH